MDNGANPEFFLSDSLEKYLMHIELNPYNESWAFWVGVFLGVVMKLWGYEKVPTENDDDFMRSPTYFWLIVPSGFMIAVVTAYHKEHLYKHWLFGKKTLLPILIYFGDFFFGITLGILALFLLIAFKIQITAVKENIPKTFIRFKEYLKKLFIPILKVVGFTPLVMPDLWDRFTAESQIKRLEFFLNEIDNPRDRHSLEFWKDRLRDTEASDFTFRISLGENKISELGLKTFKEKQYLGIEFWKSRDGTFRIRTTEASPVEPRKFSDVTAEQRAEIEPWIKKWYRVLK